MKKWSKKKKITILLLFLVLLALFAGLCWKKRRGIYNTYMKLTNQEIPYSVKEKRKKKYGYYGQKLNVTMDVDDTISIQEDDDSVKDRTSFRPADQEEAHQDNDQECRDIDNPSIGSFCPCVENDVFGGN